MDLGSGVVRVGQMIVVFVIIAEVLEVGERWRGGLKGFSTVRVVQLFVVVFSLN